MKTFWNAHPQSAPAQQLLDASLAWADEYWDEAFGLLWASDDGPAPSGTPLFHTVRSSLWYATGLLMRRQHDDLARALRILDKVLDYQFDAPGMPFHGTFYRAPEEPHPPALPQIWQDYDPNWREFIMSTYAVLLIEFEALLPAALQARIDTALRRAIEGSIARDLRPGYTNIALMFAFVLCFAGNRLGQPDWIARGEHMAQQIHDLFAPNQTFDEYNSPTYYGIDFYALALWRRYPAVSAVLAPLGAIMEAQLWRETALFYHAGMRNFCGPYDRSYGMDARRYIAALGLWMALELGLDAAPLPDLSGPFQHQHDLALGPLVALLGVAIPADVLAGFKNFGGDRFVTRTISSNPERVATAWLSDDYMLGAEFTSRSLLRSDQLHAATLHWRHHGQDGLNWLRVCFRGRPIDARATEHTLLVESDSEIALEFCAPGYENVDFRAQIWDLPGMRLQIDCDAPYITSVPAAEKTFVRFRTEPIQALRLTVTLHTTSITPKIV